MRNLFSARLRKGLPLLVLLGLGLSQACSPEEDPPEIEDPNEKPSGNSDPHVPPPSKLTVELDGDVVELGWSAPPVSKTRHELTGYAVHRYTNEGGPDSFDHPLRNTASLHFRDASADPGERYFYVVQALYDELASEPSNEVSVLLAPGTPQGVAVQIEDGNAVLSWHATKGAEGYEVRRAKVSPSNQPLDDYEILGEELEDTEYRDDSGVPGIRYGYQVRAHNESGKGGWSQTVAITTAPPTPVGLVAQGGVGSVSLSWESVPGATAYLVERSSDEGETFAEGVLSTQSSFVDQKLEAGQVYTYVVRAQNNSGASSRSEPASAITAPPPPTDLTVTVERYDLTLSWQSAKGASEYRIYWGNKPGSLFSDEVTRIQSADFPPESERFEYTISALGAGELSYYKVSAANASGESSKTHYVEAQTAPATPTGLDAVASGRNVTLSWNPVPGSSAYRLSRASSEGGPWELLGQIQVPTVPNTNPLTHQDKGLESGTTYWYSLAALNPSGESDEIFSTGVTTSPAQVEALAASTEGTTTSLSWKATKAATQYYLCRSTSPGGNCQQVSPPSGQPITDTQYQDTGRTPGSVYYYRIQASNQAGSGPQSPEVSTRPHPASIESAAFQVKGRQGAVELSWSSLATAEHYEIEYRAPGANTFEALTTVNAPSTTYLSQGLESGGSYDYRVRGVNEAGPGEFTTKPALTLPAAPAFLSAVGGDKQVNLEWKTVPSASHYRLYRHIGANPSFNENSPKLGGDISAPSSGDQLTQTDDTLTQAESEVWYVVRAYNPSGAGPFSEPISASTFPDPVHNISSATGSRAQVSLKWQPSRGATSYLVELSDSKEGAYNELAEVPASTDSLEGYVHDELPPGTRHWYRIIARNSAGDAAASNSRSAKTAPAVPEGLKQSASSSTSITLSWSAATGAELYQLQYSSSESGDFNPLSNAHSLTDLNYLDEGLSAGTTRWYRVRSKYQESCPDSSTDCTSPWSAPVAGYTNLGEVDNFRTQVLSASAIDLRWNSLSGAQQYLISVYDADQQSWEPWGEPLSSSQTSLTVTGLNPGQHYSFQIIPQNATGPGLPAEASATTHAATPQNLVASAQGMNITLTWPRAGGAKSYILSRSTRDDGGFTSIATPDDDPSGTNTYIDEGLSAHGHTYYYYVSAVNELDWESAHSNTASATTIPGTPAAPDLQYDSGDLVVSWPSLPGSQGYKVYGAWVSATSSAQPSLSHLADVIEDSPGQSKEWRLESPPAGHSFVFAIRAYNQAGEGEQSPDGFLTLPPEAPSNFSVIPRLPSISERITVELSWSCVTGASQYRVERKTLPNGEWITQGNDLAAEDCNSGGQYSLDKEVARGNTFIYRVRALNRSEGGKEGPPSEEKEVVIPPATPSGFTLALSGGINPLITVSWSSVHGADSYRVMRRLEGDSNWIEIDKDAVYNPGINKYELKDGDLELGTLYRYVLYATNAGGDSPPTDEASMLTTPAPPLNLVAIGGHQKVELSWSDQDYSTGYQYRIYRALSTGGPPPEAAYERIDTTTDGETSWLDSSGLEAGRIYYYRVAALNGSNEGPLSEPAHTITLPPTPRWYEIEASEAYTLKLSWHPIPGADSTQLYRIKNEEPEELIETFNDPLDLDYIDSGLEAGATYTYYLIASNASGDSDQSGSLSGVPFGETFLLEVEATGPKSVELSWEPSGGAIRYEIYRSEIPDAIGGPTGDANFDPSDSPPWQHTVTGLSAGVRYYFTLVAINSSLAEVRSNQSNAITYPDPPYMASASDALENNSPAGVTVTVEPSRGASSYRVMRGDSEEGPFNRSLSDDPIPAPTTSGAFQVVDSDYAPGKEYWYVGIAMNESGESVESQPTKVLTLPAVPGGVQLVPVAGRSDALRLSWEPVTSAQSYVIERSGSRSPEATLINPSLDDYDEGRFYYVDEDLPGAETWTYRIHALNESGKGPTSAPVNQHLKLQPPTNLSGTVNGVSINLSWSPVDRADGYTIYRAEDPNEPVEIGTVQANEYTEHLETGKTYVYQLAAYRDDESSVRTAKVTLSTRPSDDSTPPEVTGDTDFIDISWSSYPLATHYTLERTLRSGEPEIITIQVPSDDPQPANYSYRDKNLQLGEFYTYRVLATNEAGSSGYSLDSEQVRTAPPAVDSSSIRVENGVGFIALNWDPVGSATSYTICSDYDSHCETGLQETSWQLDGLSRDHSVEFTLYAVNESGSSPAANAQGRTLGGRYFCVADQETSLVSTFPWEVTGNQPPLRQFGRIGGFDKGTELSYDVEEDRFLIVADDQLVLQARTLDGPPPKLETLGYPMPMTSAAVHHHEIYVANEEGWTVFSRQDPDFNYPERNVQTSPIEGLRGLQVVGYENPELMAIHSGGLAFFSPNATGTTTPLRNHSFAPNSLRAADYNIHADWLVLAQKNSIHVYERSAAPNSAPEFSLESPDFPFENLGDVAISGDLDLAALDLGEGPNAEAKLHIVKLAHMVPEEGDGGAPQPDPAPDPEPELRQSFSLPKSTFPNPLQVYAIEYPTGGAPEWALSWTVLGENWVASFELLRVEPEEPEDPEEPEVPQYELKLVSYTSTNFNGVDQPLSLAWNEADHLLIVGNKGDQSLRFFNDEDDGHEVEPSMSIVGEQTRLKTPSNTRYLDDRQELYVADGNSWIKVFATDADGDVPPSHFIQVPDFTPVPDRGLEPDPEDPPIETYPASVHHLAYNAPTNELFAVDSENGAIYVFDDPLPDPGSGGSPVASEPCSGEGGEGCVGLEPRSLTLKRFIEAKYIQGGAPDPTPLSNPSAIAIDSIRQELFVAAGENLLVYALNASGQADPLRHLSAAGSETGIVTDILIDPELDEMWLINDEGVLLAFPRSWDPEEPPTVLRRLEGPKTGLKAPSAMSFCEPPLSPAP